MNRSSCRFGCVCEWAQGTTIRLGADHPEEGAILGGRLLRCGLSSKFFDHFFSLSSLLCGRLSLLLAAFECTLKQPVGLLVSVNKPRALACNYTIPVPARTCWAAWLCSKPPHNNTATVWRIDRPTFAAAISLLMWQPTPTPLCRNNRVSLYLRIPLLRILLLAVRSLFHRVALSFLSVRSWSYSYSS